MDEDVKIDDEPVLTSVEEVLDTDDENKDAAVIVEEVEIVEDDSSNNSDDSVKDTEDTDTAQIVSEDSDTSSEEVTQDVEVSNDTIHEDDKELPVIDLSTDGGSADNSLIDTAEEPIIQDDSSDEDGDTSSEEVSQDVEVSDDTIHEDDKEFPVIDLSTDGGSADNSLVDTTEESIIQDVSSDEDIVHDDENKEEKKKKGLSLFKKKSKDNDVDDSNEKKTTLKDIEDKDSENDSESNLDVSSDTDVESDNNNGFDISDANSDNSSENETDVVNTDLDIVSGSNSTETNQDLSNDIVTSNLEEKEFYEKKKEKKIFFKVKDKDEDFNKDKKVIYLFPKRLFSLLSFIIIFILLTYSVYITFVYKNDVVKLKETCSPIDSSEKKSLDVNSTLVQDLYSRVRTNIIEDYSQPSWNDTMRLYLAYRQIPEYDKYESNCTLFKSDKMEPYKCDGKFTPRAFKVSTLVREWKKLFGEETPISLDNIKLQNSCVGGFQYIPERDEFVEGYCSYKTTTSFKVTKALKEAVSDGKTIMIKEEVKYKENEKLEKPSYLKSGTYIYTFRLDMNYNYVLVGKSFDNNY